MEDQEDLETRKKKLKREIRELDEIHKYYLKSHSKLVKNKSSSDPSQSTKKPPNTVTIDLESVLKNELYRFAGMYCEHFEANSFIFAFHSLARSKAGDVYYLQIVDENEARKLGIWSMPQGMNLERILETHPIAGKKHFRSFLRCVKHNLDCIYQRKCQYQDLQEILNEYQNYDLGNYSTEVYTRLVLQMFKILDSRTEKMYDIILYINYKSDEIRPFYVAVDSCHTEPLPEDIGKQFRSCFSGFKYLSLKDAFEESAQNLSSSHFEWDLSRNEDVAEYQPSPSTQRFLDKISQIRPRKKNAKDSTNDQNSDLRLSDEEKSLQSSHSDYGTDKENTDDSAPKISQEIKRKGVKKKTVMKNTKQTTEKPPTKKPIKKNNIAVTKPVEKPVEADLNANDPLVENLNVPQIPTKSSLKSKVIEPADPRNPDDLTSPKKASKGSKRTIRFSEYLEPNATEKRVTENEGKKTRIKSTKINACSTPKPIDENAVVDSRIAKVVSNFNKNPSKTAEKLQKKIPAFSTPINHNVIPEDPGISKIEKASKTKRVLKKKKDSTPSSESENENAERPKRPKRGTRKANSKSIDLASSKSKTNPKKDSVAKSTEKATEKAMEKPIEKSPEKSIEKSPEKAIEKSIEKSPEKSKETSPIEAGNVASSDKPQDDHLQTPRKKVSAGKKRRISPLQNRAKRTRAASTPKYPQVELPSPDISKLVEDKPKRTRKVSSKK